MTKPPLSHEGRRLPQESEGKKGREGRKRNLAEASQEKLWHRRIPTARIVGKGSTMEVGKKKKSQWLPREEREDGTVTRRSRGQLGSVAV